MKKNIYFIALLYCFNACTNSEADQAKQKNDSLRIVDNTNKINEENAQHAADSIMKDAEDKMGKEIEMAEKRNQFYSGMSLDNSIINYGVFGGVKPFTVTVKNNNSKTANNVIVKVNYVYANDNIGEEQILNFGKIKAGQEVKLDTKKAGGVRAYVVFTSFDCDELNFCYKEGTELSGNKFEDGNSDLFLCE